MLAGILKVSTIRRIAFWSQRADFFFDRLFAVAGIRVVTQPLRRVSSGLCFQCLEKISQRFWVIPRLVQNDCANGVGLRLVRAGVLQHESLRAKLNAGFSQLADNSPS